MLAKDIKLSRKDNIREIIETGTEIRSSYFVIKISPSDSDHTKFAVVVSSKISKKAVERNKLRRRIYEIIRLNLNKFSIEPAEKIVILTRSRAISASYKTLENELIKIL